MDLDANAHPRASPGLRMLRDRFVGWAKRSVPTGFAAVQTRGHALLSPPYEGYASHPSLNSRFNTLPMALRGNSSRKRRVASRCVLPTLALTHSSKSSAHALLPSPR